MGRAKEMNAYRLGARQTWRLAAVLLVVYYPILLYVDLPLYIVDGAIPAAVIVHEGITIIIVFLIFYVWIAISERLLNVLFKNFGEEYLVEFNLLAQLLTVVAALIMGFGFVIASREALAIVDMMLNYFFASGLVVTFPEAHPGAFWDLYKRANIAFFLIIMLSAFYLIANRRAQLRIQEAQSRSEQLSYENTRAQLAALREQVNPHFLFNSLSILSTLVNDDPKLSTAFIHELAQFYRYSLAQGKEETVPLETELDFIRSYVFLLKMRFGDKINIIADGVEPTALTRKIAPLTLQMLIENAVKHNQFSIADPLMIYITSEGDYVSVRNNLHLRDAAPDGTQVGLQNIIARYAMLTALPVEVKQSAEQFIVRVPFLV